MEMVWRCPKDARDPPDPHSAHQRGQNRGVTPQKPAWGPPPPHLLCLPAAVEATLHVSVFFPVAIAVGVVGEEGVEGFAGSKEVVLQGFLG